MLVPKGTYDRTKAWECRNTRFDRGRQGSCSLLCCRGGSSGCAGDGIPEGRWTCMTQTPAQICFAHGWRNAGGARLQRTMCSTAPGRPLPSETSACPGKPNRSTDAWKVRKKAYCDRRMGTGLYGLRWATSGATSALLLNGPKDARRRQGGLPKQWCLMRAD